MRYRFLITCILAFGSFTSFSQSLGVFTTQGDVGHVLHPGSASYDPSSEQYKISGSGTNIWFTKDEFHYVYRKMKGDFILTARGHLIGKGKEAHRKFGWMIRTSLDTGATMASATVHGDGLTSLQFRRKQNTNVEEVKSSLSAPDVVQLERRGNTFIMSVAHFGDTFTTRQVENLDLGDEVYVGLFVCAHNKDNVESAEFDDVRVVVPAGTSLVPYKQYLASHLELLEVNNGNRKIIYTDPGSIQAPNWRKNGKELIYNSNGLIYQFDLASRKSTVLNTGKVKNNNNDHVFSFDGKKLGLSSSSPDGKYNSVVYTVSAQGGEPRQITPTGPSYCHGWSPDGKYLVFTGQRDKEFDIYRVPATGGQEVRLTTAPGLDDGPEYSPDGKYIYFNSVRSGLMQIWRMDSNGGHQTQLTSDEFNNWFPHISPDGKWIVFISFMQDVKPDDHPFYKHVYIRMMPVAGGKPKVLAYLYGGQGTINTPSWSPDSKRIAFVSNTDLQAENK